MIHKVVQPDHPKRWFGAKLLLGLPARYKAEETWAKLGVEAWLPNLEVGFLGWNDSFETLARVA